MVVCTRRSLSPLPQSDIADARETRLGPCILCATVVSKVSRHSGEGRVGHTGCHTGPPVFRRMRDERKERELGVQAEEYMVVLERENTVG